MKKRTVRGASDSKSAGGSAPVQSPFTPSALATTASSSTTTTKPAFQTPATVGGGGAKKEEPVTWASIDPRNSQTVDYAADVNAKLEAAYQAGAKDCELVFGTAKFTIHFQEMVQKNTSGGQRRVVRRAPVSPLRPPAPFTMSEIEAVMKVVEEVDRAVVDLEKNEENRHYKFKFQPGKSGCNVKPVLDALDRIIAGFKMEGMRKRYGCDAEGNDAEAMNLQLDQPVPNYFANAANGQSIYHRKLLSLCGLRNLVLYGPEVYGEMHSKLFSGALDLYGRKEGPNKMRYFTGNAVDLDYVVLRCNDKSALAAVNATRKKHNLPQFKSGDELAKSDEGKQIAITATKQLIDDFVGRFKLSAAEVASRHLDMDANETEVHVATDNKDRGQYPLWHYHNVGQSSFHANVPNMPDIYGALLKAPYHLAKAMVLIFARYEVGTEDFARSIENFYEDAVADSCFNAKWKAIEEFCLTIESKGGIQNLLSEMQAKHQNKFSADFFSGDPDRSKEEGLMVQLSSNVLGRDDSTGLTRKITPEDVSAWIKATE